MTAQIDLKPYLLHRLGKQKLQGLDSDEWRLDCPACNDGSGHYNLWFNIKKNQGICYKCQHSFRPITLVQGLEDCTFLAAAKIVKELTSPSYFSVEGLKRRVREALDVQQTLKENVPLVPVALPREFKECRTHSKWPPYILKRVGSTKMIMDLGLGWCDSGYYANRLVIPITLHGEVVLFVARAMWKPCNRCKGKGCGRCDYQPYKAYLYPKGAKTGRVLYNYDRARVHEHVALVEGAFDAIRVGHRGMAVLGSNLSDYQLELLLSSDANEISLIYDPDKAGRAATEKSIAKLKPFYKRLRVVTMPDGKDPDFFDRDVIWQMIHATPLLGSRGAMAARVRTALDTTKMLK